MWENEWSNNEGRPPTSTILGSKLITCRNISSFIFLDIIDLMSLIISLSRFYWITNDESHCMISYYQFELRHEYVELL